MTDTDSLAQKNVYIKYIINQTSQVKRSYDIKYVLSNALPLEVSLCGGRLVIRRR